MQSVNRIPAIDGMRTLAVIGVIFAHIWGFFDNVSWKIGPVDINKVLSFGRNGVDLFFVISGFCMYLMYGSKIAKFSSENFFDFLKRRWLRIAPAFYVLIIIETIRYFWISGVFPFQSFFYHLFFINIFLAKNDFSPHYWSLATEFHFYLLFPFLFLRLKSRKDLQIRIIILTIVCIIFRFFLFYMHKGDIAAKETISSPEIWYRFVEFGFGIIAAVLFIQNKPLPAWISGSLGFILGFLIAYAGRICMLTEFVNRFGKMAFILRTFGEPIMTFGFGWMILSLISSPNLFNRILSWKPFLFLGKISYSMYLFHWLIAQWVSDIIKEYRGSNLVSFYVAILISLVILVPVSWLSFRIFEAPYFKKNPMAKKIAYVEVI